MKKIIGIALICVVALALLGCPQANGGSDGVGEPSVLFVDYTSTTASIRMVAIAGTGSGTFPMGNADTNIGESDDERPVRDITLRSFYLGSTEITESQWETVMGAMRPPFNPESDKYDSSPEHPARYIKWYDAIRFCNKLSKSEGLDEVYYVGDVYNDTTTDEVTDADATFANSSVKMDITKNGYRLPTEAEWEYAAGGGDISERTKWAGTDNGTEDGDMRLSEYAVYDADNPAPVKVGRKPVSEEYDLYDMSGNVWEWCWDLYGDYDASKTDNPTGATLGFNRVMRGGAWGTEPDGVRVAFRHSYAPGGELPVNTAGFRVARSVN